jgi:hypothetical protein
MIDAGAITMAISTDMTADTDHRNRRETRQRAVEEFEQLVMPDLPQPMATIVADCARAGLRSGQGKGRAFLPQADKDAREIALKEAAEWLPEYRERAKAEGRPRSWARQQAAEFARQRMQQLGVANPPSIKTLLKRGFAL